MVFTFSIPYSRVSKLKGFTPKRLRRLTRLVVRYGLTASRLAWERFKKPWRKGRARCARAAYRTLSQLGIRPWRPPVRAHFPVRPVLPAIRPANRPRTPGRGPAPPTGPPDGEEESDDSGGEDSPPSPQPRRAKGRGRFRKTRRFRAFPQSRTYKNRIQKLNAVAAALEGQGGLFVTLTPLDPPDDRDRRLGAVPPEVAQALAAMAARLRRDGATFALVVGTRAENGAFWPHGHLMVAGVSLTRLQALAARSGLAVAYAEPLQNPKAAARYIVCKGQKKHWDGILGARGFYANLPRANPTPPPESPADLAGGEAPRGVSLRNAPGDAFRVSPSNITPGLELAPGIRIADPAVFLTSLARDLKSHVPTIRQAAQHRLDLLRKALAERGPP